MKDFRRDIKELLETTSGLKVFPLNVPDKEPLPYIQLSISGGGRDGDSSLTDSLIRGYRFSAVIIGKHNDTAVYDVEELFESLHNKPYSTSDTDTMIIYFDNSVELFNYATSTIELTVDFIIKKLN